MQQSASIHFEIHAVEQKVSLHPVPTHQQRKISTSTRTVLDRQHTSPLGHTILVEMIVANERQEKNACRD